MKKLLLAVLVVVLAGCDVMVDRNRIAEEKKMLEQQNQFIRGQIEMLNAMAPACVERLMESAAAAQQKQALAAKK